MFGHRHCSCYAKIAQLESQMSQLSDAVAKAQSDVTTLQSDVAALQTAVGNSTFSQQDVANVEALDASIQSADAAVKALAESLTPPAPPAS